MPHHASEPYVSSGAFAHRDVHAMLETCERRGIAGLELSSGLACDAEQWRAVRRAQARGLRVLVHNYFPAAAPPFVLNLGAADPEIRGRSLKLCRRAIELSNEVEAPFYSVHSAFAVEAQPEHLGADLGTARRIDRPACRALLVDALGELCDHARTHGLGLAIENHVLTGANAANERDARLIGVTPDELLGILDEVGRTQLGVLLDFGHANVSARTLGADREAWVLALAPHALGFHVSDNDGFVDSNRAPEAACWALAHVARYPAVPVALEAYGIDENVIERGLHLLRSVRKPLP